MAEFLIPCCQQSSKSTIEHLIKCAVIILIVSLTEAKKSPMQEIHHFLTKEELKSVFDVERQNDVPDYDVVFVKKKREVSNGRRGERGLSSQLGDSYVLKGNNLEMELKVNTKLVSSSMKILKITSEGEKMIEMPNETCHYLAYGNNSVAAVSNCASKDQREMRGLILLPGRVVSLHPIPQRLRTQLGHLFRKPEETKLKEIPHVIQHHPEHDDFTREGLWNDEFLIPSKDKPYTKETKRKASVSREFSNGKYKRFQDGLYLELAVFLDQSGYEKFMPFVKDDEKSLRDMLLGFVNQIQALYYQPSLKNKLQISLVHLEIQAKQPADLPHHDGNHNELLTSFCKYQAKKNPSSDSNPGHWDMALYLSGLNFFAIDDGVKSETIMGLAPVNGVCMKDHSCVISEFGAVDESGRPYTSAGLTSAYVAAHEMGHSLGMHHDGPPTNTKCPSNGFIMSPSRGTRGETVWSACSAKLMTEMKKDCLFDKPQSMSEEDDHSKYQLLPGQIWDAYDQCRVFLRDEEATIYNDTVLENVCEQTLCKTPNRIGYYAAGPALDGTFCGRKRWCQHGKCTSWGDHKLDIISGGWSEWTKGKCESGCITKSKGAKKDTRKCDNPKPKNTEKVCEGGSSRISICDDSSLCNKRIDVTAYSNQRCKEFSKYVPDVTPVGVQVPHQDGERSWQACAIYCKTKIGSWYTPRHELNDKGVQTSFPDGTWCHKNGKQDYYCQDKICQPARNGRDTSGFNHPEVSIDILNNAIPKSDKISAKKMKEYFEYKKNGKQSSKPLSGDLSHPSDDDYVIDTVTSEG